jgi:hypothetical protein
MIFGACINEPISKERIGKDDGFEVKVYRFFDNGHYHYFTTKGETISTQTAGKTTYSENIKSY